MPPSKNLSFDELAQYFHLPINQVAKELGVCATILKKTCRKNGIPRWPHRKIKSLDNRITNLQVNLNKNPQDKDEIAKEIDLLQAKKAEIMKHPDIIVRSSRIHSESSKSSSSGVRKRKKSSKAKEAIEDDLDSDDSLSPPSSPANGNGTTTVTSTTATTTTTSSTSSSNTTNSNGQAIVPSAVSTFSMTSSQTQVAPVMPPQRFSVPQYYNPHYLQNLQQPDMLSIGYHMQTLPSQPSLALDQLVQAGKIPPNTLFGTSFVHPALYGTDPNNFLGTAAATLYNAYQPWGTTKTAPLNNSSATSSYPTMIKQDQYILTTSPPPTANNAHLYRALPDLISADYIDHSNLDALFDLEPSATMIRNAAEFKNPTGT